MISRRRFLRAAGLGAAGAAAWLSAGCGDEDDGATATVTRPPAPTPSETERAADAVVRQIDHILLRVDDAQRTLALLTETLALPLAWPLFEYRGFHSGAAGFGNVNLEVLQHASGEAPEFARDPGAYLIGMAFEPPTVDGAVAALDARGIAHGEPAVDGLNETIAWTSVDMTGPPECPIQLLVKYRFDQDARRRQLGDMLVAANGGPLRVVTLAETLIGVRDPASATARWQALLDPLRPSEPGLWRPGDGPAIRLVEGDDDRFEAVVLRVRSLAEARAALRERSLLGEETADWAAIDLDGRGGTAVRVAETTA